MNASSIHTKQKMPGKYMGLGLMALGAFFLFDPYFSALDILPDALGYLFIYLGLRRMADLDDRLAEALKGVRYLALIGVGRILAFLLSFGLVAPSEQPVFILLVLFTLGVLDCIVLIPMWKNLCSGLTYLGSRNGATAMLDRKGPGGRLRTYNAVERYTAFSVIFFLLREALAILPETTVLTHEKGGVELSDASRLYDFVGLFRLVGVAAALVLGIIWLVLTLRLMAKLKADTVFFERIGEKYRTEVLTRRDLLARRSVRAALLCLLTAAVFCLDFYLDGVNLLPDTIAAVFLILAVVFLRPYTGKNLPALVSASAYGAVSAACWLFQLYRTDHTEETAMPFTDSTHGLLQTAAAALLVASVLLILRSLAVLAKRYTGIRSFRDENGYPVQRTEAIHRLIGKKLTAVAVLAVLTGLSALYFWLAVPIMPVWAPDPALALASKALYAFLNTTYQIFTDGYWFIDLALGALWIAAIGAATGEISEQMEYSAMMED